MRVSVLLSVVLVVACGVAGDSGPGSNGEATQAPASAPEQAEAQTSVREAYINARQQDAPRSYDVVPMGGGAAEAENSALGARLALSADGVVTLVPMRAEATWSLALTWTALGRAGSGEPMREAATVTGAMTVVKNQATYAHRSGGVEARQWLRNGPLGLQQGFTLTERPAGSGELVLTVRAEGLTPVLSSDGSEVLLRAEDGKTKLRYSDLYVRDADEAPVPAHLAVAGGHIELRIDDAEASYPLQIDPLVWLEKVKLIGADTVADDTFGEGVAISGDTALIGAPDHDAAADGAGAVYVFVRNGSTWTEQAKLTASDAAVGDGFGRKVALDGETALVGSVGDDDAGNASGAAYVFVRNGTTWTEQQKLTASDAAADDWFAFNVALSGDTALIGTRYDDDGGDATGSAYVFVRSGTTWTEQQKLTASDAAVSDQFGFSVSLDGDTALVGAWLDDDDGSGSGSAYVFVRNGTTWTEQQKLTASDAEDGDTFGRNLALDGDTALISAPGDDDGGSDAGAAYVFVRNGTTWTEQQKLVASDAAANDLFSRAPSIHGDTAVIGAFENDDNGSDAGAAYVFVRSGTTWTEQTKLTASDAADGDLFGRGVAVENNTALISAVGDDDAGGGSGSVYVFRVLLDAGSTCSQDDECHSEICVDGVCCDTACGGGATDDCQACNVSGSEGTCSPVPAGSVVCRPSAGVCDVDDTCDGASTACPADAYAGADTVCRPAASQCDTAEACNSASPNCPTDELASDGTSCDAGNGVCQSGSCVPDDGAGGGGGGEEPTVVDEGCGCRVVGQRNEHELGWLLAGVGLVLARRRRTVRRAS